MYMSFVAAVQVLVWVGGGCHFRAQKSINFRGPPLPMALEIDFFFGGGGTHTNTYLHSPLHKSNLEINTDISA